MRLLKLVYPRNRRHFQHL